MYSSLPDNVRHKHPYFMYEEIKAQSEAVARSLALAEQHAPEIVRVISGARRVFVAGSGTSLHAAAGAAWLLRSLSRGKVDARAIQSFELVTYLPGLRSDDVVLVFSHSGGTTMAVRALERANITGCATVLFTGFPESKGGKLARHVVPSGFDREESWAHTASYTAALAGAAAVANGLAVSEERLDLGPLPEVMHDVLGLEEMVHRLAASTILAERYKEPADIVLIGSGPNEWTAREAELKILETSYLPARAFELEQSLHGPLASLTSDSLVIVIAPPGPAVDRAAQLCHAVSHLEIVPMVLCSEGDAAHFETAHRLILPDIPEVLSPISSVVPLQLLSYFLAVGKSLNPDLIHRDDEHYRALRGEYE